MRAWLSIFVCLGAIIIAAAVIALRTHHSVVRVTIIHNNGEDPPPIDDSKLSQEDIAAIKSDIEWYGAPGSAGTQSFVVSDWLAPYRLRTKDGDYWEGGTSIYGGWQDVCPLIIWLKGHYGLYCFDPSIPDPVWQKTHPRATSYVELRKNGRIIFVVPDS